MNKLDKLAYKLYEKDINFIVDDPVYTANYFINNEHHFKKYYIKAKCKLRKDKLKRIL